MGDRVMEANGVLGMVNMQQQGQEVNMWLAERDGRVW